MKKTKQIIPTDSEVYRYANAKGLNTDTPQNFKDAKNDMMSLNKPVKERVKIAIIVNGGCVVALNSNNENVEYVIIDHDNFDIGCSPVSDILHVDRVSDNIYELYDSYSPIQDSEVRKKLKKLNF